MLITELLDRHIELAEDAGLIVEYFEIGLEQMDGLVSLIGPTFEARAGSRTSLQLKEYRDVRIVFNTNIQSLIRVKYGIG